MSESNSVQLYSDALVVLGTAGIIVPLVRRWGINPILGYLGAGALLGPLGLGSLIKEFPFLYWATIVDADSVSGLAELGVVFLLFLIGLELSFQRLITMRRLVFGLGGLQFAISAAVLTGIVIVAGQPLIPAAVIGMCLALSSTAIVLDLLGHQGRLATSTGRASFSILLMQDLAVVPILVFISIFSTGNEGSVWADLGYALAKAAIAIGVVVMIGRFLLRPLFQLVTTARSTELFVAAALFVIIGAGLIAHAAGLSMALGAFIVALMLAETAYGKAIESAIDPLKGLLLGLFFFTVGMKIDFREFLREPFWLPVAIVGLIVLKAVILTVLGRLFKLSWPAAIETGLLLGPGGEFAFVGIGMAAALHLVPEPAASFILAATAVTMAATPLLSSLARRFAPAPAPHAAVDPALTIQSPSTERRAIVVGFGRVGKVVCALLEEHKIKFIAIDNDAAGVARDRKRGHPVYYGDASDNRFLETAGLPLATAVIITTGTRAAIDSIVEHVREIRPDISIISRAADEKHASHLYALGVTDAVPETVEASLQLSEAALIGLGIQTGPVIASIHEKRDQFRHTLQEAAKKAGRGEIHSVRKKSAPKRI
ncbi:cation:proton antiporter [Aestuariivirga litoralis]|uniref:cation:proton antiporter domain-containing protein n=1 Tax=Aestuariivirga litoralis TaxID=2650924 RepID=UPI0018C4A02C|nr:potassium transporter TrkA [Aestuariivirga litoralis]